MNEQSLFERAIAISDESKRLRFVDEAFSGKETEKARFLQLLEAHACPDYELLDAPECLTATAELTTEVADEAGNTIGPYKLLQKIGEGGFGAVYLAEESGTINRRIALKIIKPGMGSKEVIARFEAERQALAMMDHDNIARVFGGGTTENGLPYFVMELVKGIPITTYCEQKKLPPDERLRLFINVCRGVQHAHQKGVIHRDLKPSNILVAEYDHRAVVKIIDFGVAKALNQKLTEQTLFTQYGSVIGTMQYMSPEQAKFNQLDVDTRSDVYSLGAVLYELLTGDTPISKQRVKSASFEQIIRWIREEEPSKPSTKLSSPPTKPDSSVVPHSAVGRQGRLARVIRRDLDWIVMKALEKDRDRRYGSASEFADDVQRFLEHEPVLASPPSLSYRAMKFVRRHQYAATSLAAVSAMGLVALIALLLLREERFTKDAVLLKQKLAEFALSESLAREDDRKATQRLESTTIPTIEDLVSRGDRTAAFELLQQVRLKFPHHERLQSLAATVSSQWQLNSQPPESKVTLWRYDDPTQKVVATGKTPMTIELAKGYYAYRMELDGHDPVLGFSGPNSTTIHRKLDAEGTLPDDMVRIPAAYAVGIHGDFLIDRHEVTNRQFKKFVDAGGYQKSRLWMFFASLGNQWREVVSQFQDTTGKPGPRFWKDGTYLPGTADLPVVGVSWAEAAAYAAFVDKSLPSVTHWEAASGLADAGVIAATSNFSSSGVVPVNRAGGLGPFGTEAMFGNAAEWCFNAYGDSAHTTGGNSFRGPLYNLHGKTPLPSQSRENFVGFRCFLPLGAREEQLYAALADTSSIPFDGRSPVSDSEFEKLIHGYRYDADLPLQAKLLEQQVNYQPGVTRERHEIATAYGDPMPVYVYRKNGTIPHDPQILVYLPGADGFNSRAHTYKQDVMMRNLVKSGRICVLPIVYGMYERGDDAMGSNTSATAIAKQVKDVCRTVDFLLESEQYRRGRLSFLGRSYGGRIGPIVCAIEPRLETAIYWCGGLKPQATTPECDTVHFAPRAKQPALMVNGVGDHVFPVESSQKPMFDLLGAPDDEKEHVFAGVGHSIENDKIFAYVGEFLDRRNGQIDESSFLVEDGIKTLNQRGINAMSDSKWVEAENQFEKVIELLREEASVSHQQIFNAQRGITVCRWNRNPELAISYTREALSQAESELPDDHVVVQGLRTILGDSLSKHAIQNVLNANYESDSQFAIAEREIEEVNSLLPGFAWASIGQALIAIRKADFDRASDKLKACERLPFTWNLEFIMRARLAVERENHQEAQDWMRISAAEQTQHYITRLPQSSAFFSETQSKIELDGKQNASLDHSIERLLNSYPEHYYLHWICGVRHVRQQQMEEAHEKFETAFDLCPGTRATDWYSLTALWMDDQQAIEKCRSRLVELAELKYGCYVWDGIHLARHYSLASFGKEVPEDVAAVFQRQTDYLRGIYNKAPEVAHQWINLLTGHEVRIEPFTQASNPEEQAESMILGAITEYQFGNKAAAYEELAKARQFAALVVPDPDRPAFKYIDAAHAWCHTQLLLRTATSLIDLKASDLDTEVTDAVVRLRSELEAKFGPQNADQVMLQLGRVLTQRYGATNTSAENHE